jgi:hypothetical protein
MSRSTRCGRGPYNDYLRLVTAMRRYLLGMVPQPDIPSLDGLIEDLRLLRAPGLLQVRRVPVDALYRAALHCGFAYAGFGTTSGTPSCSWNNAAHVKTRWAPNTDLLVRHHLAIPYGAKAVHIEGDVDNDADVYVNGHLLQHVADGHCGAGGINVYVPAGEPQTRQRSGHPGPRLWRRDLPRRSGDLRPPEDRHQADARCAR